MPINILKKGPDAGPANSYPLTEVFRDSSKPRVDPMAIEKEAYQRGFESGERAGMATASRKMAVLAEKLGGIVDAIDGAKERMLSEWETEMVELAYAIAERVMRAEVSVRKEAFLPVLRDAIKESFDAEKIIIRLNPSDLRFIEQQKEVMAEIRSGKKVVVLEEDETVGQGGCRIVSEHREIDATIQTQLEELYKNINPEAVEDAGD